MELRDHVRFPVSFEAPCTYSSGHLVTAYKAVLVAVDQFCLSMAVKQHWAMGLQEQFPCSCGQAHSSTGTQGDVSST